MFKINLVNLKFIFLKKVILLDEPTSGLDSFTAFLLILTLSRYAR
jgi:ABC-type multidrug transport system ATPase subunit